MYTDASSPLTDINLPWLMRGIWKETPEDFIWKRLARDAPAYRPFRPSLTRLTNATWESHRNLVETAGHRWCNLMKDIWSCFGPKYAQVLKQTPAFNRSFALSQLPHGTNMLVHGNSHVALPVITLICQSMADADVEVYRIGGRRSDLREGAANSLVAYLPTNNVSLLLLSNEYDGWDKVENYQKLFRFLSLWQFYPRVVFLGEMNRDNVLHKGPREGFLRFSKLRQQFPEADVLRMSSKTLQTAACIHPWCSRQQHGHSCTPGPVLRHAERLGATFLQHARQQTTGPARVLPLTETPIEASTLPKTQTLR